jgi:hypothetical protein
LPKTINPIRRAILKENRIKGISARQSLLNAGYTQNTANRTSGNKSLKIIDAEILSEQAKKGIIDKAWKVVENDLEHPKYQHNAGLALSLKDMTDKRLIDATVLNRQDKDILHKYITVNRLQGIL